jgi:hypothetical protein
MKKRTAYSAFAAGPIKGCEGKPTLLGGIADPPLGRAAPPAEWRLSLD